MYPVYLSLVVILLVGGREDHCLYDAMFLRLPPAYLYLPCMVLDRCDDS